MACLSEDGDKEKEQKGINVQPAVGPLRKLFLGCAVFGGQTFLSDQYQEQVGQQKINCPHATFSQKLNGYTANNCLELKQLLRQNSFYYAISKKMSNKECRDCAKWEQAHMTSGSHWGTFVPAAVGSKGGNEDP